MVRSESPDPGLSAQLGALARRHWPLVVSVAAVLVLIVFVPEVWQNKVEVTNRRGYSRHIAQAWRGLGLAGTGVAIYAIAGIGMRGHWSMRAPSDGENAVGRWLLRAMGLGVIWFAFYLTLP